ncbi:hypothetical protein HPB50_024278 [Hyalomma asiaticum]|uniref:Uncharacterized protein n=1 Tax=Hyalomma asiaticum TaxID=266040 RepID=A0ACB7RW47_HYAAI|nr:hypothetical protein HPB50_024278 [Hyalomma asiaticum]
MFRVSSSGGASVASRLRQRHRRRKDSAAGRCARIEGVPASVLAGRASQQASLEKKKLAAKPSLLKCCFDERREAKLPFGSGMPHAERRHGTPQGLRGRVSELSWYAVRAASTSRAWAAAAKSTTLRRAAPPAPSPVLYGGARARALCGLSIEKKMASSHSGNPVLVWSGPPGLCASFLRIFVAAAADAGGGCVRDDPVFFPPCLVHRARCCVDRSSLLQEP